MNAPSKEDLSTPANLERTNLASFIPREVFLDAIREKYSFRQNQDKLDKLRDIVRFIDANEELLHPTIPRHEHR